MSENQRDENGRFLPGNKFWLARSSHGANPKFTNPDDLWSACCEYFEWSDNNPLHEARAFAYEGNVTIEPLPKMRAMTLAGLCMFLDIEQSTWREWRHSRPDLLAVIKKVDDVIYRQKFEGASAGMLNTNIIARDLGLADRNELSGPNGGPIETETRTWREKLRGE